MFVILFLLWIVFNGKINGEIALFGAVLSGAVYAFCWKFLDYSPKKELAVVRLLPRLIRYLALLVKEIVKSNVAVLRIIYSRRMEIKPQLVTFRTPLKGAVKSLLADCITVTPGTISVHSADERLTVHCLDAQFADGIENTAFQQSLLDMSREADK